MKEDNIKVTRWLDGESRVVTVNDKALSETEIVDLLVEYMEENNNLYHEILDFKVKDDVLHERIENLEKENKQLILEIELLKQTKPIRKLPKELRVIRIDDENMDTDNFTGDDCKRVSCKKLAMIKGIMEEFDNNDYTTKDLCKSINTVLNL